MAQLKPEPKHPHAHRAPQLGLAGYKQNAYTTTNTHPNTPAGNGGAQPKPECQPTHTHHTHQPVLVGYRRSAHTNTHRPGHPSQERPGTGRRCTPTNTPKKPEPGVARRSREPSPSTHTHTAHPSQEWLGNRRSVHTNTHRPQHPSQELLGAAEARAQAPTPTPRTPAGIGGVRAERVHNHTHTPQQPSQEWRGAAGNRAPAHKPTPHTPASIGGVEDDLAHKHTDPNKPARSGGAQPNPVPEHTHPHRATQPALARYKRNAHTTTRTPQHPSQEWQGTAETRAQVNIPTLHTPARIGRVTEGAGRQTHTDPNSPARSRRAQLTPEPKHTHPHRTAQPGVAGYSVSIPEPALNYLCYQL